MIVGLDLAPRKCGWAAGDGSTVPMAGGFRLTSDLQDLGPLMAETLGGLLPVLLTYRPRWAVYESPILPSNRRKGAEGPVIGTIEQRRAQMGQGAFLEWVCSAINDADGQPIPLPGAAGHLGWRLSCVEEDPYAVKYALTGSKRPGATSQEQKDAMVAAALRVGVVLPALKVDGREDAADALGAWLIGVRCYAKQFLADWDRRVFSRRGALL